MSVDVETLEPGDSFETVAGDVLVVVGFKPAGAAPEGCREDGRLYEGERRGGDGDTPHILYRPHHFRQALDLGSVEYAGVVDDVTEVTPFWCAGCEMSRKAEERHSAPMLDVPVCTYGCKQRVETERRKNRIEEDA